MKFDSNAFNIILYLTVSLLFAFLILGGITFLIYKLATKKHMKKPHKAFVIVPFVILIISVAAYILNMGWYRVILLIFPIAPLHGILFFFTSLYASDHASSNRTTLTFSLINYILFPMTYILLPDFEDIGGTYMFFGLIKNDAIINAASPVAVLSFIASVALILLQLITTFTLKRKERLNNEQNQNI